MCDGAGPTILRFQLGVTARKRIVGLIRMSAVRTLAMRNGKVASLLCWFKLDISKQNRRTDRKE
jgi:hypothetical protein